ncbi:hypothetical protein EBL87_15155 [Cereibacter sphaeroides]|uniref:hypothetical protein n=1 Tax=Cereibacter sphaeroides TaxID=1063 RepID=UPI000F52B373|nr:hypothetical protein [Cereibacter sphaeroides]AZB65013.1 hypothetical protein EBL87_15155 [Cereibacter sphaeroides]AZB67104.1 hypothetical protein EBL86_01255 [Cereibacter sphaeroides]
MTLIPATDLLLHQLHQEILRHARRERCRCLGADDYCACQGARTEAGDERG